MEPSRRQRAFETGNARRWLDANRPLAVGGVVIVLVLAAVVYSTYRLEPSPEVSEIVIQEPSPEGEGATLEQHGSEPASKDVITVHVVGAVSQPGVYLLDPEARAVDAVAAAGGFGADSARETVNLAQPLLDGCQLRIPTRAEVDELKDGHTFGLVGPDGAQLAAAVLESSGLNATALVDVNSADAQQLETLPGIGPSTSMKIIAEREAHGRFVSLKDLIRVSGIGEKKVEALEGLAEAR